MVQQQKVNTLLRVILGVIIAAHGIAKFQMGIENVAAWFGSIGLPEFLAYGVAGLELFGGIALIIGLATRYVSAAIIALLLGAIFTVKLDVGFLGDGTMAGYELDLALFALAVHLFAVGSDSAVSVDQIIKKKPSQTNDEGESQYA
jgi:putative oxidoreductase